MSKLPIFSIVRGSYTLVIHPGRNVLLLALTTIALSLLILLVSASLTGTAVWFSTGVDPNEILTLRRTIGYGISMPLYVIGVIASLVLFSVGYHRLILVPDKANSVLTALIWRRRHTRYLGWVLFYLILLALIPPVGLYFLFSPHHMLLPATSVDQRWSFEQLRKISRGNGWNLFWIILFAVVPAVALFALLGFPLFLSYPPMMLVSLILLSLWPWILAGLVIASLSTSYRHLMEASVSPPPSLGYGVMENLKRPWFFKAATEGEALKAMSIAAILCCATAAYGVISIAFEVVVLGASWGFASEDFLDMIIDGILFVFIALTLLRNQSRIAAVALTIMIFVGTPLSVLELLNLAGPDLQGLGANAIFAALMIEETVLDLVLFYLAYMALHGTFKYHAFRNTSVLWGRVIALTGMTLVYANLVWLFGLDEDISLVRIILLVWLASWRLLPFTHGLAVTVPAEQPQSDSS